MKTHHLGFRVNAFIPGVGRLYDLFELKQAAIECAYRVMAAPNKIASNTAWVEEVTRDQSGIDGSWIEDEQFTIVWQVEEAA